MSKFLFMNPKGIHAECIDMYNCQSFNRDDRKTLREYFSGKSPFTDDDLQKLGLRNNVNYLTGHQVQTDNADQLYAVWNTQNQPFQLMFRKVDRPDMAFKQKWEALLTAAFNNSLKKSKRFDSHFKSLCGDTSCFGVGGLVNWDNDDWRYEYLDVDSILLPRGSGMDPETWSHWCFETTITVQDLYDIHSKKTENWKINHVKAILDYCFDVEGSGNSETRKMLDYSVDQYDDAKMSHLRLTNSDVDKTLRTKVKVFVFFQKDQESGTIQKSVILREIRDYRKEISNQPSDSKKEESYTRSVLYQNDNEAESMDEVWIPFNMETNIGGKTLWEEVIGQGVLNYEIDMALERILNRLLEHFDDSMRNLYAVEATVDVDELERLLLTNNGILPEGVGLAENRIVPKWQEAFSLVNFFTQLQERQGDGNYSNTGGESDQLEVQFRAEQSARSRRITSRISLFNSRLETLGWRIYKKLMNLKVEEQEGFAQKQKMMEDIADEDIPAKYLKPSNIEVKVSRIPGDGNDQRQLIIYQHYSANIDRYPPESKPFILNLMDRIVTQDPDQSDLLSPVTPMTQNNSHIREALSENAIILVLGVKVPISINDVDPVHIQMHLQGISFKVEQINQNQVSEPMDQLRIQELGAHAYQHIQRLEQSNPDAARAFVNELNSISSEAEKVLGNFPPQTPQQQQQESIEERKVIVQEGELARKAQKDQVDMQKWIRTQMNREQMGQFQNAIQAGNLDISQARLELDRIKAETDILMKSLEAQQTAEENADESDRAD